MHGMQYFWQEIVPPGEFLVMNTLQNVQSTSKNKNKPMKVIHWYYL